MVSDCALYFSLVEERENHQISDFLGSEYFDVSVLGCGLIDRFQHFRGDKEYVSLKHWYHGLF